MLWVLGFRLPQLTHCPRTGNGFWALGLDGGTGGSEEAGALDLGPTLGAQRLEEDLVLTGEEQTWKANEVLLVQQRQ